MGAQSSVFSHELKNPTRTLHSSLHLHPKSSTFTFSQDMKKGVGEEQLLTTRVQYSGVMERQQTDVRDSQGSVIVRGNPVYLLKTERVRFEVEWGHEWYQSKKGRLTRDDIARQEAEAAGAGTKDGKRAKVTPIVTATGSANVAHQLSLNNINTAPTAPPSPSRNTSAAVSSSSSSSPSPAFPVAPALLSLNLPPAMDSIPRGFSHSAPLSPAPLSLSERQRSHIDAETGLGERPAQPVTALEKHSKIAAAVPAASSATSLSASSSSSTAASKSQACSSPSSASPSAALTPRTIHISYNGSHHAQLQQATSLEEMTDFLQQDTADWSGTFSCSALQLRIELLSSEVRVEYWKPKFEYLWAQVQDECPIIMALSNVFHDSACCDMYLPRGKA